jgi:predicted RNA-binding protein YlxR (DUF448 family)
MFTSRKKGKHVPQRTCVSCRTVKDKQELVRLVRLPDKGIEVDLTGKKAGRGVYLCRARECWETGIKSGRLENSLRTTLSRDDREELIKVGQGLFGNDKNKSCLGNSE